MTSIKRYLVAHIWGEFGIYRSFLLHLLVPYVALILLLVGLQLPLIPGMAIFMVVVGWGVIGCIASGIKTIRSDTKSIIHKGTAILVLGLISYALYVTTEELLQLF